MRFLFLGLICIQLFASGYVKTEGKLSVKGNAPFTFLALTESGGKVYKITGKHEAALLHLQGNMVRLSGILESEAKGPGFPAVLNVTAYEILPARKQSKEKPETTPSTREGY